METTASPTLDPPAPPPPPAGKAVPCSYCDVDVVGSPFVLCETCEVPLHRDCWAEAGKCPTYACGSTRVVDPAVALFRKQKGPEAVPMGFDEATPAPALASPPPAAPAPARTWGQLAAEVPNLLLGFLTGGGRFSAISIDLHLGGGSAPAAGTPGKALEPAKQHAALEGELERLRWMQWIKKTGVIAAVILMPWGLKAVSKNLVFPMVVAIAAWNSLPIWGDKRRVRDLEARLEMLRLPAA